MMIDVIFAVAMVFAIFKGYSKGLIVALFSVAGFVIGLAAALKLSSVLAAYFAQNMGADNARWLPFFSFIVIMLLVMFLVRMLAGFVQKTFEFAMLGWINRLGGILLYAFSYSVFLSVLLFYAKKMGLVSDTGASASVVYPYLKELGPKVMEWIGVVVPWFKNIFTDLKDFFGKVGTA